MVQISINELYANRFLYYKNNQHIKDEQNIVSCGISYEHDIFTFCIKYFTEKDFTPTFPNKSFCVAFIYAKIINQYTNIPLEILLSSPTLLFDDPFFAPLSNYNKAVYDFMNINFSTIIMDSNVYNVKKTVEFCLKEMGLYINTYNYKRYSIK